MAIFIKLIAWIAGLFIAISLLLVVLYKFVPVPVTATMLMDPNGITKDWEPLDKISPNLVRAAIGAEDGKFCSHDGFDTEAIERAMRRNTQGGRIRGGSTISQQTAKNVFLWQGGGYFRKGLEAWFTFLIEQIWGKRRIMEVYLNVAETGIGTYGAERANEATTALMAAVGMGGSRRMRAFVSPDPAELEALILEAVRVVVALGVDVDAVDEQGRTAADVTRYDSVVDLLSGVGRQ